MSPDPKRYVIIHPKHTDVPLGVWIDGDYDVDTVQYLVDGQVVAGGGRPTFTSSWDCRQAEDRYYEIVAQATLSNGGVLRSSPVRVWLFNYLVDSELTRILIRQLRERDVALGGEPGTPVRLLAAGYPQASATSAPSVMGTDPARPRTDSSSTTAGARWS